MTIMESLLCSCKRWTGLLQITQSRLSIYSLSTAKDLARQYRRLDRKWTDVVMSAKFSRGRISRLKYGPPHMPIVTHNLSPETEFIVDASTFRVRLIMSCADSPMWRPHFMVTESSPNSTALTHTPTSGKHKHFDP